MPKSIEPKLRLIIFVTLCFLINNPIFAQTNGDRLDEISLGFPGGIYKTPFDTIKTLREALYLSKIQFQQTVDLRYTQFQQRVSFGSTEFQKGAYFHGSVFNGPVDFIYANFFQDVDFEEVHFQKGVIFLAAKFQGQLNFADADFQASVNFSYMETTESAGLHFVHTKLPNLIDFSQIPILYHDVDFTAANFDSVKLYTESTRKWHYINLYNSDISKITIDYQHFRLCFYKMGNEDTKLNENDPDDKGSVVKFTKNSLVLNKMTYALTDSLLYKKLLDKPEIQNYLKGIFPFCKMTDPVIKDFLNFSLENRRFAKKLSKDQIISIYEKVLKNFDVNGQKESYKALDIEYRDFKNGGRFNLSHIWNLYGYAKEWIFYWTGGFLLFFTIITSLFIVKLNRPIENNGFYYMANIPSVDRSKTISSIIKRSWYSLVYTSAIFFLIGFKVENINFKRAGAIYIIIIYSIGILCLGYMANFVLQK